MNSSTVLLSETRNSFVLLLLYGISMSMNTGIITDGEDKSNDTFTPSVIVYPPSWSRGIKYACAIAPAIEEQAPIELVR